MHRSMRRGFTLVEMLVVIIIIGILAAILVPTVGMAIRKSKETAISMEMNQLASAMDAYNLDRKDYPPDFSNQTAIVLHLRKAFPRSRFNVGTWMNPAAGPATRHPRNLDAAEALVFWLSLTTDNPRNPISGQGDKKIFYEFKKEQLTDLDNDGWPEYVPKHGPGAPYVYFDGRLQATNAAPAYAYAWAVYPSPYSPSAAPPATLSRTASVIPPAGATPGVGTVRPYRSANRIPTGETKTWPASAINNTLWISPNKFQIVCGGLDNHFGYDNSTGNASDPYGFKKFPNPNYYIDTTIPRAEDLDNLASFSEKTVGNAIP